MAEYQYSKEFLQYTREYQLYLAVRDMCTIMVALHREEYDRVAEAWKRHEGPHFHLTIQAINAFMDYLVRNGQDPAAWARDYDAYAGGEDISVRDMCRMMVALHRNDSNAAADVWNEHEGLHFKLATEAIHALRGYLMRDGQDPIEWARGYEAYAAEQAGCQPSLGGEKRAVAGDYLVRNDEPEGLTARAIEATTANLGITSTKNDWKFSGGDDTSEGRPYVEHHLTPGRLWLRVTGGFYDENQQPSVRCGIWCPEVLGGDSSVPMERFCLDGLRIVMGPPADSKPHPQTAESNAPTAVRIDAQTPFRARMRGKWGWATAALLFLVGLLAGGLASALVLGGATVFLVGIVAGIRGLRGDADSRHRGTALAAVSAGLVAAFCGVVIAPDPTKTVSNLPMATSAPASTSLAPAPTSAATPSPQSTVDGKSRAEAEAKRRVAKANSKGSSASFEHFRVTVSQVSSSNSQVRLQAKVCVKSLPPDPQGKRTRISWDPWSIRAGSRTIEPDSHASPLKDEFPADATYRVGQCASGWIPFATNRTVSRIAYANGVGDRAVWDPANLAAQPTTRTGEP